MKRDKKQTSDEDKLHLTDVRLDHIGIAVRDVETALQVYSQIGIETGGRETILEQGVEVQMLLAGEARIELIQPTSDDSPVARFLEKHGEGLHHIAFEVNDLEDILERLRSEGVRLIDEESRVGVGGSLIAFVNPRSAGGVLIELVQYP